MAFASAALLAHHRDGRDIGVTNFLHRIGWRSMLYWRVVTQIQLAYVTMPWLFYLWVIVRCWSLVLAKCGLGRGDFASSIAIREYVLKTFLNIIYRPKDPSWGVFWHMYFLYAKDGTDFIDDYTTAWSMQSGFELEIVVFVDNSRRLVVPCLKGADDKALLEHLHIFYDLTRTGRGVFELLGVKSSQRIDVVELHQGRAVGKRLGVPLELGRHGSYSRQIHYFKDASDLTGTAIRDRLLTDGVLTSSGQQTHALNIVRDWDPHVTSMIILFPVLLSLSVSIIWSVVAAVRFKADVQTSTQTGFTIGSYVVTAGTLLIALVAFLDTKVNAGER